MYYLKRINQKELRLWLQTSLNKEGISLLPDWKQVLKPKSPITLSSEPPWHTHSLESQPSSLPPSAGRSLKNYSLETDSPRITVCKYRHFEVATKKLNCLAQSPHCDPSQYTRPTSDQSSESAFQWLTLKYRWPRTTRPLRKASSKKDKNSCPSILEYHLNLIWMLVSFFPTHIPVVKFNL